MLDLILSILISLLLIPAALFSSGPLTIILGILVVLFIPGYVLVALLFPEKDSLGLLERITLSFGLSIAIVTLAGLVLNYSPWGLRLVPIFILLPTLITVIGLLALLRRYNLPYHNRFNFSCRAILDRIKSICTKPDLSRINLFLILVLLCLVGFVIRLYPEAPFSLLPGHWDAYFAYPIWHLPELGHISEFANLNTAGYTSAVATAPLFDQGYFVYNSTIVQVMHLSSGQYYEWLRYFLVIPILIWPMIGLTIYNYLQRSNGFETTKYYLILIWAFSILGLNSITGATRWTIIANSYAVMWTVLGLWLYCLVRGRNDYRFRILFILCCTVMASYYNTFSIFFLITAGTYLAAGLLQTFILRKGKFILDSYSGSMLLVIVITLAWYIYLNFTAFSSDILVIQKFIQNIGIFGFESIAALETVILKSETWRQFLIAGMMAVSLLPLIYTAYWVYKNHPRGTYSNVKAFVYIDFILLGATAIFAAAIFPHSGAREALNRINEMLPLIAIIGMALAFSVLPKTKLLVSINALLIISILAAGYLTVDYIPTNRITVSEQAGIEWTDTFVPKDKVVFTDARLGMSFAMYSRFKISGASMGEEERYPYTSAISDITAVYYENDGQKAFEVIGESCIKSECPEYALFSRRMGIPEGNIKGHTLQFKPASSDFLNKFDDLPSLNLLYTDGTALLYGAR